MDWIKRAGIGKLGIVLSAMSTTIACSVGYAAYSDGNGSPKTVAEDLYSMTLNLNVPQVSNNSSSAGERRYMSQTVKGEMAFVWREDGSHAFRFGVFENTGFKVGGRPVTYEVVIDREKPLPVFCWIGSNGKGRFRTPTMSFSIVMEPSYAIGDVGEDNSFYLTLSGKGSSSIKGGSRIANSVRGKAVGTQGCGCSDYGHLSPTREAGIDGPSDGAMDIAATEGTWSIRFRRRVRP